MFVWPGRIAGGQRFSQPVSMLDMLPTILDLVDLPMPEVMMGQSLAPLLRGEGGWEPRPVILDCRVNQTENCFPMIPSGAAHYDMLLGPEDEAEHQVSEDGMVLV